MKYEKRDLNIEYLRIFAAFMVLTYHVVNTCVNFSELSSIETFFAYSLLWAGGRIAVNIFVIISAWYLIESKFKSEKVFKIWIST